MILHIIGLGLLSAFMILLITKLGIREHAQTFAPKIISKLFSCDFCLCFWSTAILSFILSIFVSAGFEFILYPFLATPIARKLL